MLSGRIAPFGKTKREIESAILQSRRHFNARIAYKRREIPAPGALCA